MSTTALPVGLPSGYDLTSAEQIQQRLTFAAVQSSVTITVPGGEAWLMQAISGRGTREASATDETLTFELRDDGGNPIASVDMAQDLVSGTVFRWTFAAGINTTATEFATNTYRLNQSLPMVIAQAGYSYRVFLSGAAGSDTILEAGGAAGAGVYYAYTRWYAGGTSPDDGGNELLGPYMLVPGPETA